MHAVGCLVHAEIGPQHMADLAGVSHASELTSTRRTGGIEHSASCFGKNRLVERTHDRRTSLGDSRFESAARHAAQPFHIRHVHEHARLRLPGPPRPVWARGEQGAAQARPRPAQQSWELFCLRPLLPLQQLLIYRDAANAQLACHMRVAVGARQHDLRAAYVLEPPANAGENAVGPLGLPARGNRHRAAVVRHAHSHAPAQPHKGVGCPRELRNETAPGKQHA